VPSSKSACSDDAAPESKTCHWCGEPFTRGDDPQEKGWALRKYCGRRCAREVMRERSRKGHRGRIKESELKGVALTRVLRRRIEKQVAWVFEVKDGAYVRSDLIRAIRAANEPSAERILGDAMPRKKGALLEGTRRRVMQRIKALGVVGE